MVRAYCPHCKSKNGLIKIIQTTETEFLIDVTNDKILEIKVTPKNKNTTIATCLICEKTDLYEKFLITA